MPDNAFYPIGLGGSPWGDEETKQWLSQRSIQRSYREEVITKLKTLENKFDLIQYDALIFDAERYPLYALKTKYWDTSKPIMLITGGVHGYETSGVQGAIQFMQLQAENYSAKFNIVALPCISPWGYENIYRWNPYAIDPNRSFIKESPSQESASAMKFIAQLKGNILIHVDLHETTDSDETEFRPALAARNGQSYIPGIIPDGFYLVADTENKQLDFQTAIINAVKKVTHIAPSDNEGFIIGEKVEAEGIICYPVKSLNLCTSMTNAHYATTTEVYPDSPNATAEECNLAQVTALTAALDFVIEQQL